MGSVTLGRAGSCSGRLVDEFLELPECPLHLEGGVFQNLLNGVGRRLCRAIF